MSSSFLVHSVKTLGPVGVTSTVSANMIEYLLGKEKQSWTMKKQNTIFAKRIKEKRFRFSVSLGVFKVLETHDYGENHSSCYLPFGFAIDGKQGFFEFKSNLGGDWKV